jgi:radical SAM superfamily enzyme YgiQ (UPF0313 family)
MDVLLLNPPYSYTEIIKGKGSKKATGFYVNYPHLGFGYLAACLEEVGFEVGVIDASASGLDEDEIVAYVAREKPKVIGLTVTTETMRHVYRMYTRIKDSGAHIVVGGYHVTLMPSIVPAMGVRYGIVGDGERSFTQLCLALLRGEGDADSIDGLVVNRGGLLRRNPSKMIEDLDALPWPARHLFPNDAYFSPVVSGRITSMLTQRGCPFDCGYCSRTPEARRARYRSPARVVDEMEHVVRTLGVRYVNFEDETFTLRQDRIFELCAEIGRRGVDVKWGAQSRANLLSEPLVAAMARAGCRKMSFGLESGSDRIRAIIHKKVGSGNYAESIRWCHDHGIETNTFIMFGHPSETLADMRETIEMVKELNPTYAGFNITLVLPGTAIYDEYVAAGKIDADWFNRYMRGEVELPVYVPEGLREEDVRAMHKRATREFYLRPRYLVSQLRRVRTVSDFVNRARSGLAVVRDFML